MAKDDAALDSAVRWATDRAKAANREHADEGREPEDRELELRERPVMMSDSVSQTKIV